MRSVSRLGCGCAAASRSRGGDGEEEEETEEAFATAVAVYSSAFSPRLVNERFESGAQSLPKAESIPQPSLEERRFTNQVAPLLAKRCLECHDIASAKGDLVLDRKADRPENSGSHVITTRFGVFF